MLIDLFFFFSFVIYRSVSSINFCVNLLENYGELASACLGSEQKFCNRDGIDEI